MNGASWFVVYGTSDSPAFVLNPRTETVQVDAVDQIEAMEKVRKLYAKPNRGFVILEVLTREEWEEEYVPARLRGK